MTANRDTVLLLMEAETRKPRFVFKCRDWKQTRRTQDQMAAEGIPLAMEELFSGSLSACDQFVANKVAEFTASGIEVEYAHNPSQPRPPRLGQRVKHEITGIVYQSVAHASRELGVPFARAWRSAQGKRVADRVPIHYL